MAYKHEEKTNGQLIRSADWNAMGHELERLEAEKVSLVGGGFSGPLAVTGIFTGSEGRFNSSLSVGGTLSVAGNTTLTGKVGIGTTDPGAFNLRVDGSVFATKYVVRGVYGNTQGISWLWDGETENTGWGLYVNEPGVGKSMAGGKAVAGKFFDGYALRLRSRAQITTGLLYENNNEELNFSVRGSDGYTYVRGTLNVNGSVGIGTDTPAVRLDVDGYIMGRGIFNIDDEPTQIKTALSNKPVGTFLISGPSHNHPALLFFYWKTLINGQETYYRGWLGTNEQF